MVQHLGLAVFNAYLLEREARHDFLARRTPLRQQEALTAWSEQLA